MINKSKSTSRLALVWCTSLFIIGILLTASYIGLVQSGMESNGFTHPIAILSIIFFFFDFIASTKVSARWGEFLGIISIAFCIFILFLLLVSSIGPIG